MDKKQIEHEVQKAAEDGRISCHEARALAEKLEVPYSDVGKVCDALKIKLHSCELGCF
jgi:LAO/AO transport system kinase